MNWKGSGLEFTGRGLPAIPVLIVNSLIYPFTILLLMILLCYTQPSIDNQGMSVDVARGRGQQEHDAVRKLLCRSGPAGRVALEMLSENPFVDEAGIPRSTNSCNTREMSK